jgi:hypothetical protein
MNNVSNRPVSRAAMMRDKQRKMLQQRANAAVTVSTSSPTDSSVLTSLSSTDAASTTSKSAVEHNNRFGSLLSDCNNDKLLWAKLLASKAHAETTNIAKQMGKMEELERGMALLEKMRPVIGEQTYADGVRSLFASLPNFKGFDAAVDIINVESAVDRTPSQVDFEKWTTTNKRRSTSSDNERNCTRATKNNSNEAVVVASNKDDNNDSSDEDDYVTEEEGAKYITYHDITDKNGKVVAVKAIDSCAPLDA